MELLARFQEYADAFEEVFESDDWSRLEPYFTENAVYEIHAAPPFGARNEGEDQEYVRLSYATAKDLIREGLRRMKLAIENPGK